MEKVHALLHNLSKPQLKILKVHLRYLAIRKEPDTQLIKLTDHLLQAQTDVPDLENCAEAIYGEMNYHAIQKLKSRLLNKIHNVLLLDHGMEHRGSDQDELDRYIILIRRKVALYHTLLLGGGTNISLSQEMEEIIRLAKKYELFSVVCEQLKYKKLASGFRKGKKVFLEINEELKFYKRCNDTLEKATDYYHLAVINSAFSSNADKKSYQTFLRDSIAELNEECAVLKSPLIAYYTKNIEAMYYESGDNIEVTRDVFVDMLSVITANKSVYRKQRVAVVYSQLATCDIRLGDYDSAIENAQAAQKNFAKNSANYCTALENQFLAHFYQFNHEKSKSICAALLKSARKEVGNFRYAKYLFYQANVLFMQEKFKEVLQVLNLKLELTKDKIGWDFNIRVLTIQTLLELGRTEDATRHVQSLIKRDALKPRDKTIFRILHMLERQGFDGTRVRQKLDQEIFALTSHKSCMWEPISSELIPFEKWLTSHYKISLKKVQPALSEIKSSGIY
jgi:tetratricopeptide (TPR) repeat protein